MSAPEVVVVSGEGRYADPWHDFPGTSARIAEIVRDLGLSVQVRGTTSNPVEPGRLLVVDAGGGSQARPAVDGDAEGRWRQLVLAHAEAGGPVLAVHAGTNTFYEDGRWAALLGGRWVPGTSMHPPLGPATVQVSAAPHPITEGLPATLDIVDERYSYLEVHPAAVPLLTQEHDDLVHTLVWAHAGTPDAPVRAVADALGHDVAAYGPVRADLLRREIAWLLG